MLLKNEKNKTKQNKQTNKTKQNKTKLNLVKQTQFGLTASKFMVVSNDVHIKQITTRDERVATERLGIKEKISFWYAPCFSPPPPLFILQD